MDYDAKKEFAHPMPNVHFNLALGSLLVVSIMSGHILHAQSSVPFSSPELLAGESLPDSPGTLFSAVRADPGSSSSMDRASLDQQAAIPVSPQVAKKYAITIKAGESAQPLSAGDKFTIGVRRQLTLGAFASWNVAAGFSHLMDNRPHYGTDSAGFGERLGATALRDTSQSIFFFGVYSNLFHQDPRYYVLGPQHTAKERAIYAATRVVVTRKDNGGSAPNWSLISAIASSSALTNAYYPYRDRNISRTFTGLVTSLAIRTGTQQLREFSSEIRQHLHLKR